MRVVVAALRKNCPAHLALTMEGVEHDVLICRGKYGYGRHLAELWRQGEGFILVEHDIAPWPTAIKSMIDCSFEWCTFAYPMNEGAGYEVLGKSLGCTKFGDHLLQRFPDLWKTWEGVPWQNVDGHLEPSLRNAHMVTVHQHVPPVAHVKVKV